MIDQLNTENQQISTLMIDQVEIIASDHSFAYLFPFVRKIALLSTTFSRGKDNTAFGPSCTELFGYLA